MRSGRAAWGLLPVLLVLACAREPARPNLVLVVLDTVRADRLSAFGYGRPTAPHLEELCERGIRFTRVSAPSSWTVPSHASLFTGVYPRDHGATQERPRLGPGLPTLAEILRSYGYAAWGVSGNPLVGPVTGLDRGFDHFEIAWSPPGGAADPASHPVLAAVRRLLTQREEQPEQPLFLFVNLMDAHAPNTPSAAQRTRFLRAKDPEWVARAGTLEPADFYGAPEAVPPEELAALSDLYDAEVAEVDALVGALVDQLESAGVLRDALLVVTADHGEAFGEHGHIRHVFQLYGTVVKVPLCVLAPDRARAGEVRPEAASLVDVFTTLLARAAPPDPGLPGRDLLGSPEALEDGPVFSEYYTPLQALRQLPAGVRERRAQVFERFRRRLRSVEQDGLRLLVSSTGEEQLFDVAADPDEERDLAGAPERRGDVERLEGLLREFVARGGGPPPPPAGPGAGGFGRLDPETAARLRALGYLDR